jgi:hypothetical protein
MFNWVGVKYFYGLAQEKSAKYDDFMASGPIEAIKTSIKGKPIKIDQPSSIKHIPNPSPAVLAIF